MLLICKMVSIFFHGSCFLLSKIENWKTTTVLNVLILLLYMIVEGKKLQFFFSPWITLPHVFSRSCSIFNGSMWDCSVETVSCIEYIDSCVLFPRLWCHSNSTCGMGEGLLSYIQTLVSVFLFICFSYYY